MDELDGRARPRLVWARARELVAEARRLEPDRKGPARLPVLSLELADELEKGMLATRRLLDAVAAFVSAHGYEGHWEPIIESVGFAFDDQGDVREKTKT